MVYRGIDPNDEFLFILPEDRDSSDPVKTEFWLRPQTVRTGNKSISQYVKANQKNDVDSMAAETTKGDSRQFHTVVARIVNFQFRFEEKPTPEIVNDGSVESRKLLNKVFSQLDVSSFNKIMNASREPKLGEADIKESSSSSGADSSGESPAASVSTASSVES